MSNTTPNRRYRLLKDLPYVKAGAIYEWDGGTYICDNNTCEFIEGVKWDGLGKEAVENAPTGWFEEVVLPVSEPVKEKIEMGVLIHSNPIAEAAEIKERPYDYHFFTNNPIDREKVEKAILSVLNNDTVVEDKQQIMAERGNGFLSIWIEKPLTGEIKINGTKVYLESEVDAVRKEAFDAGRDRIGGFWNEQIKNWKYQKYSDYLSSLSNSSSELKSMQANWQDTFGEIETKQPSNDTGKEASRANMKAYTNGYQMGYKTALKYKPKQHTNENAFVWTDELVDELLHKSFPDEYFIIPSYKIISDFKQSKLSTPVVKHEENYEFNVFDKVQFNMAIHKPNDNKLMPQYENVKVNGKITQCLYYKNTAVVNFVRPDNMQTEVREFSFSELNKLPSQDPTPASKPLPTKQGKEWEIECLIVGNKNYWIQKNGKYHSEAFERDFTLEQVMSFAAYKGIHSVKRISDGELFLIGDKVECKFDDGKAFQDTIHHFTFTSSVDIIDVYFDNTNTSTAFDISRLNISKLP